MPKIITSREGGGVKFIKTKAEVAAVMERLRAALGKNKTEFAALLDITPENYNHMIRGTSYPSFKTLSLLSSAGVDIRQITDLTSEDVASIEKGKYDK